MSSSDSASALNGLEAQADGDVQMLAHLQREEAKFVELNVAIARLCRLLGVRLACEDDVQRILDGMPEHASRPGDDGAARREAREWAELRALLAMRCHLLTKTSTALGLQATAAITDLAEADLLRLGFEPGSDGFVMHQRLQALVADLPR